MLTVDVASYRHSSGTATDNMRWLNFIQVTLLPGWGQGAKCEVPLIWKVPLIWEVIGSSHLRGISHLGGTSQLRDTSHLKGTSHLRGMHTTSHLRDISQMRGTWLPLISEVPLKWGVMTPSHFRGTSHLRGAVDLTHIIHYKIASKKKWHLFFQNVWVGY